MENKLMLEENNQSKKYCKRCHRELKDEKSKQLGFGQTCYKKFKKENKNYLFKMEANNDISI